MDIDFEPRGDAVAPKAPFEAAAAPEAAHESQKSQEKTQKLKATTENATERVLQPETPPQEQSKGAPSAGADRREGKR